MSQSPSREGCLPSGLRVGASSGPVSPGLHSAGRWMALHFSCVSPKQLKSMAVQDEAGALWLIAPGLPFTIHERKEVD